MHAPYLDTEADYVSEYMNHFLSLVNQSHVTKRLQLLESRQIII